MDQENIAPPEDSAAVPPDAALTPAAQEGQSFGLGLEFLRDVPLEVTVELGSSQMSLGDVLSMGPGALIDLNKPNGEPLDIKVNGVLVAKGEAVVIHERFGVRLTSVMEPARVLKTISS